MNSQQKPMNTTMKPALPYPVLENPHSPFLEQVKGAIDHAEQTAKALAAEKFRNSQLETVLKIIARRNNGRIIWTEDELAAALDDQRGIMLGGLDLELCGI